MSLKINLRHLESDNVRLEGELPVAELELDIHDELMAANKPLRYKIEAQEMDEGLLVRGRLSLALDCECSRCLKPFEHMVEFRDWACLIPFVGDDAVKPVGDTVDLTPFLREDILLELPQHPLCKKNCGGLKKPAVGKPKKKSPDDVKTSSAWAELEKLKFRKE